MSKQTITEILDDFTKVNDINRSLYYKHRKEALTALSKIIDEAIGGDEKSQFSNDGSGEFLDFCEVCDFMPSDDTDHCICYYRNKLRAEIKSNLRARGFEV